MLAESYNAFPISGPIPPPPPSWTWEKLMQVALDEADLASQKGEVPVGALIVTIGGNIISIAHNLSTQTYNPCAHAEVLVIQKACASLSSTRLNNCILVVSLEPCLMCISAIALAHINGLVFGAFDSQAGAVISNHDFRTLPLSYKNFWYLGGVLAIPSKQILQNFFKSIRHL